MTMTPSGSLSLRSGKPLTRNTLHQLYSRDELVLMIRRLQSSDGTDEELDWLLNEVRAAVPDPNVSDLIFYEKPELSAEEIVDRAFAYKGIPI